MGFHLHKMHKLKCVCWSWCLCGLWCNLKPHYCWDRGFESCWGNGCLSLLKNPSFNFEANIHLHKFLPLTNKVFLVPLLTYHQLPNLFKTTRFHGIPKQSAQKQQDCSVSHYSPYHFLNLNQQFLLLELQTWVWMSKIYCLANLILMTLQSQHWRIYFFLNI